MTALLLLLGLTPSPCVELVRPPAFIPEQELIAFQVTVERHASHRLLVLVAADGDAVVRRSDEDLHGDAAPRTRWVRWRLPEGELTLIAMVFDADGEVDRDRHQVTVYGRVGY